MVKGKKKIRRRKRGATPKNYFTEDTQRAILEWQDEEVAEVRHKLYRDRIFFPFDKIAENLIFIHNFLSLHDSFEDLKSDCVTFLYKQLPKFDRKKGTKAFSYYNQIAKNFLIIRSKQRKTKIQRNVSLDDKDALGQSERQSLEDHCTVPSPDDQMISFENRVAITKLLLKIREGLVGELELRVLDCIQDLFRDANELPFLNKRAVFLYIREQTDATPKQLTTVMSTIKKEYRNLRENEFEIL